MYFAKILLSANSTDLACLCDAYYPNQDGQWFDCGDTDMATRLYNACLVNRSADPDSSMIKLTENGEDFLVEVARRALAQGMFLSPELSRDELDYIKTMKDAQAEGIVLAEAAAKKKEDRAAGQRALAKAGQ